MRNYAPIGVAANVGCYARHIRIRALLPSPAVLDDISVEKGHAHARLVNVGIIHCGITVHHLDHAHRLRLALHVAVARQALVQHHLHGESAATASPITTIIRRGAQLFFCVCMCVWGLRSYVKILHKYVIRMERTMVSIVEYLFVQRRRRLFGRKPPARARGPTLLA